jgi:FMN phosphatase YigB (HAD superfamily)
MSTSSSGILLLDLDDTLLVNPMERFLPGYFQAVSGALSHLIQPDILVSALLSSTRAMIANRQPDRTLEQVFDETFYLAVGLPKERVQPEIERFFKETYPALRLLTQPKPEAQQFVKQAFISGFQVVIATSPVFPLAAIEQRLDWAGLSVDSLTYSLVSCVERFHFSKPYAGYFTEIMAQLGWPDEPVFVIGDDFEQDISPSLSLGLPAFQVTPANNPLPMDTPNPSTAIGDLGDAWNWLQAIPASQFWVNTNTPFSFLTILLSNPAGIHTLISDFSPETLHSRPSRQDWSLTEILCHLRDVEIEVNLPRVQKIIKTDNPILQGQDTDQWAKERDYQSQDAFLAYNTFLEARLTLLSILDEINEDMWLKPARHTIFGPTNLQEVVKIFIDHEKLHIRQIVDTLKTSSPLSNVG